VNGLGPYPTCQLLHSYIWITGNDQVSKNEIKATYVIHITSAQWNKKTGRIFGRQEYTHKQLIETTISGDSSASFSSRVQWNVSFLKPIRSMIHCY